MKCSNVRMYMDTFPWDNSDDFDINDKIIEDLVIRGENLFERSVLLIQHLIKNIEDDTEEKLVAVRCNHDMLKYIEYPQEEEVYYQGCIQDHLAVIFTIRILT